MFSRSDDRKHGMSYRKGMFPVMIRYIAVVFLYCKRKPNNIIGIKPANTKQRKNL